MFQSAPPRGGRHETMDRLRHLIDVSIRAPAWGATHGNLRADLLPPHVFQSAPPRGGRRRALVSMSASTAARRFQSAPPRGGRPTVPSALLARRNRFNPRPRVGGDQTVGKPSPRDTGRFQSAPPRGGRHDTAAAIEIGRHQLCFNPRPRVGGDGRLGRGPGVRDPAGFNPRPRVGGDTASDAQCRSPRLPMNCFNPRPRVGGDTLGLGGQGARGVEFQSAPPRGGRPVSLPPS